MPDVPADLSRPARPARPPAPASGVPAAARSGGDAAVVATPASARRTVPGAVPALSLRRPLDRRGRLTAVGIGVATGVGVGLVAAYLAALALAREPVGTARTPAAGRTRRGGTVTGEGRGADGGAGSGRRATP